MIPVWRPAPVMGIFVSAVSIGCFRGAHSVTLARMTSRMTEQLLVRVDHVALETTPPIRIPIEISFMMVFAAQTAFVKTSGVKRTAVSVTLRKNCRRRTERQRDRDNNANFGMRCPSPLFGIGRKETAEIVAYSSLSQDPGIHHTFLKCL